MSAFDTCTEPTHKSIHNIHSRAYYDYKTRSIGHPTTLFNLCNSFVVPSKLAKDKRSYRACPTPKFGRGNRALSTLRQALCVLGVDLVRAPTSKQHHSGWLSTGWREVCKLARVSVGDTLVFERMDVCVWS